MPMNLPFPDSVLDNHIGIVAKTGAGKSYAAQGIAEHLLARGERVCVIDPTGRWWGLRSNAKGDGPGYPVVVFGGDHADVPLAADHGEAIAEIIGVSTTPAILDTREMTVGQRTRFFTGFAETLLRKNRGPLTLIIDEAHLFAPQGRVSDPQSGKMLHAANNLVSLGRGIALRIILISQRPAKLHKDSLTQVETLIALRLIAPQDRNAVKDWVCEWAEPAEGKELLGSLPSLKTGTGWVWSPEIGLLEKVRFPKIKTYDSGKAPAPGDDRGPPVLAPIDLQTITGRLEEVAADAIANDPARLKARIRELEKAAGRPSDTDIKAARNQGYVVGKADGHAAGMSAIKEQVAPLRLALNDIERAINDSRGHLSAAEDWIARQSHKGARSAATEHVAPAPKAATPLPGGTSPTPMPKAESTFLTVLAQRRTALTRNKVAIFAGYSVKSGHVDNTLGSLRSKGWVTGRNDAIEITDDGRARLGPFDPLPEGEDLRRYWLGKVDKAGRAFLGILFAIYPEAITRNDLAERAGYSIASGHVDNTLGRLRGLDLAEGRNDAIRASAELFDQDRHG